MFRYPLMQESAKKKFNIQIDMETEKMKMKAGKLYDANYDPELLAERAACADLTYELNQLRPSKAEERDVLVRRILGKVNGSCTIVSPFFCDYGYNIEVGENFFANMNCVILDEAAVKFGDNVFVAPNCGFYTAGHPLDSERRNKGLEYARPITVGNDVWIGSRSQCPAGSDHRRRSCDRCRQRSEQRYSCRGIGRRKSVQGDT